MVWCGIVCVCACGRFVILFGGLRGSTRCQGEVIEGMGFLETIASIFNRQGVSPAVYRCHITSRVDGWVARFENLALHINYHALFRGTRRTSCDIHKFRPADFFVTLGLIFFPLFSNLGI